MPSQGKGREDLFRSVEDYINKHYVSENPTATSIFGSILRGGATDLFGMDRTSYGPPSSNLGLDNMNKILDALMSKADKSFAERLLYLIEQSGRSPTDIYTKAGITKQHFYKIKSNPDYKPTKETALAFAVALRLSLEETNDLIGRAGYTLSHSSKSDIIVEYFIKEGIYDVDELNFNLHSRKLGTLTNRRNG